MGPPLAVFSVVILLACFSHSSSRYDNGGCAFFVPLSIVLTEEEVADAIAEANRRQATNEAKGLWGRNGGARTGDKALEMHIIGAMGEMAVAKHLGLKDFLYQEIEAKRDSIDLPPDIDVKTRKGHDRDLIVQLSDKPGKRYILVTWMNPEQLFIHGWINSEKAMQPQYAYTPRQGRKAYFIPQSALSPIATFDNAQVLAVC